MCAKVLSKKTITHVSLWKNGEPLVGQGRQRGRWELGDRAISGVTGQTGVGRTVRDKTLANLSYKAIMAIEKSPPNGFYAVDCVLDDSGIPHVTEINAGRPFTTASEFFARLGLNLADIYIRSACGESPPLPTERESPLPEGWLYIRGMDVIPLLIHEKDLND